MLKSYLKTTISKFEYYLKVFLYIVGTSFLFFESLEVMTNIDMTFNYKIFIIVAFVSAVVWCNYDGFFRSNFYRNKIELSQKNFKSKVTIEFGDLFQSRGYKVVGINDYFDSIVDERIVSSNTLHGYVLNKYWKDNTEDWDTKVEIDLERESSRSIKRSKGKTARYKIGVTAAVNGESENFLFVAIAQTQEDGVTITNAENIIRATRGALKKARAVCSNKPLVLPLLGSGLARVGIANDVLLDLIICGIFEESKQSKVTDDIKIVIHPDKRNDFDLISIKKKWN